MTKEVKVGPSPRWPSRKRMARHGSLCTSSILRKKRSTTPWPLEAQAGGASNSSSWTTFRHPGRKGLKAMGEVRVRGFAVSIDGFGAGPDQGLEHPMGKGGRELHKWFFPTRTFRSMIGQDGGTDDRFARATAEGFGAFILGRNMFGPAGDDWGGPNWKGWWGDNPPYRTCPTTRLWTPPAGGCKKRSAAPSTSW